MRTFELLIVFAALMAAIALVAIAIDWVGRPLRNRRFIPRIYRYNDEFAPEDLFAPPVHPPTSAPSTAVAPSTSIANSVTSSARPQVVATVSAQLAPKPPDADAVSTPHPDSVSTPALSTRSAFSDNLDSSEQDSQTTHDPTTGGGAGDHAEDRGGAAETGSVSGTRPRGIAETIPVASADSWHPTMALDARVGDDKATVAVKAERFWTAASATMSVSHFDDADRLRMAEGKAPRRRNPRTGDLESMELIGLRSASDHADVRMKWPDDSVDPWSPS